MDFLIDNFITLTIKTINYFFISIIFEFIYKFILRMGKLKIDK